MNNPDHISESLETIFGVKMLKFFDADPGSEIEKEKIRIRDKTSRISIALGMIYSHRGGKWER
jgi:hypothetical protein